MSIHKDLTTTNGIHYPISFIYADAAARTGATVVAADLYKIAKQTDNNTLWMLTATAPTWVQILTNTGTVIMTNVLDEDDMASNSATAVPTQQSAKAFVNGKARGIMFDKPDAPTAAANVAKFIMPNAATISKVILYSDVGPTGAALIIDIHKNGTTIFTTQANRPTIADGAGAAQHADGTPAVTALAQDDVISWDIDQIGSTVAGGIHLLVTIVLSA